MKQVLSNVSSVSISYSPLHGLSASFRQHAHAYEFAPDAGKEKKHFIDWY